MLVLWVGLGFVLGDYVVFFDIYLLYYLDLRLVNLLLFDVVGYYCFMNCFFELFERVYGMKVVVVVYLKVNYDVVVYGGWLIFFGVMFLLVCDVCVVII